MRARVLALALAAAVVPLHASAQVMSLTEQQALAQLGDASPQVRAARAGVDVARADVRAASRWPNPRVTFNREAVAGITENMVMVAQPLPVSGRRRFDVQAASARVDAASSRAGERVRRLRAEVRLAFTDLWVAQRREQELAGSRDRLQSLAGVLARREAAGDAAGFDRLRAEREVMEVETDRVAAAGDRARAQALLVSYFAAPPIGSVEVAAVPRVTERAAPPSVDDLLARSRTARGDLVALRHEASAAGFAEQSARRRLVPEPEIVAGTKSSNAGVGAVGSIFSIHVAVPIFDRGDPERAAALARNRQAIAEADVLERVVRADIERWRTAVLERSSIADRYRATVTATADQIERIAQVSYDAGERGILELLDAYRTAAAARLRQVDLDASLREAEIELDYASGWEMP
jgi:outer membrane protein, heavy metal efflux system